MRITQPPAFGLGVGECAHANLMIIIDDLLFWLPLKGLMAVFEKVHELAEQELGDESKLKEELLRTQTLYELDQISEEEYLTREAEILRRLERAVKMKQNKA